MTAAGSGDANFRNRQNFEILTEGDPILFNLYGSILV